MQLPAREGFALDVSGLIDGVSVQLLNAFGRVIGTQTAESGGTASFRNVMLRGIYYIKLTATGSTGTDYDLHLSAVTPPADRAGNTAPHGASSRRLRARRDYRCEPGATGRLGVSCRDCPPEE